MPYRASNWFAGRFALHVQLPYAARQWRLQRVADAAVERAVGHDRQGNVGDLEASRPAGIDHVGLLQPDGGADQSPASA